jgi:predicted nucleic acid-binding protein
MPGDHRRRERVVTALGDDGTDGDRACSRLHGEWLTAPHLIDLEVTSAWRRLAAAGHLDDRRVRLALVDLRSLRMTRVAYAPLIGRCCELRDSLTIYDTAYVALAELMEVTLLTADTRLAHARGPTCPIEVFS